MLVNICWLYPSLARLAQGYHASAHSVCICNMLVCIGLVRLCTHYAIGFWRLHVRMANVHSRFEPYYARSDFAELPVIDSQRLYHPGGNQSNSNEHTSLLDLYKSFNSLSLLVHKIIKIEIYKTLRIKTLILIRCLPYDMLAKFTLSLYFTKKIIWKK